MRSPEQVRRDHVSQWLAIALEDMEAARRLLTVEGVLPRHVANLAQQAAEKFLKAFLVWHDVEFPKTHDMARLLELVGRMDAAMREALRECTVLTRYAVGPRYPTVDLHITASQAARAVDVAVTVADRVRAALLPFLDRSAT